MVMKGFFCALALGLAVAGCSSPGSTALNDLRVGMSRAEVIEQLGKPETTSASGDVEVLTYLLEGQRDKSRREYFVRLKDQRVNAFGLKSDAGLLASPESRP